MKKIMIITMFLISFFVFDIGTKAAFSDAEDIGTISFVSGKEVFYMDFDLDGDLDFIIQSSVSVSLNINNGLGEFTETQLEFDVYPTITVSDYNGDLYPDLFVTRLVGNDNIIYLYENDQEGGFLEPVQILKVLSPALVSFLKWIDLDSDGKLDLVFNNVGKLYVIYGSEDPLDVEAAILLSDTISVGPMIKFHDFNKDGQVDIVFNRSTFIHSILSSGDRSYLAPVRISTNVYTLTDIGLHDMNHDGVLDVIYSADNLMKYHVYGENGFSSEQEIYGINSTFNDFRGIDSVDMNNDGLKDLVYLTNDTSSNLEFRIHHQLRSGTEHTYSEKKAYLRNVKAVGYFDVDNNGYIDVVLVQSSKISVLKNEISGIEITFDTNGGKPLNALVLSSQQFNVFDKFSFDGVYPYAYKLVDIDGDGHLDLIYGSLKMPERFKYLVYRKGTGLLTFDAPVFIDNNFENVVNIEIGDIDNDGNLDIITYSNKDHTGLLTVFKHDGNMNFTRHDITPHTTIQDFANTIKLGDVTGDGYLDILYQSRNSQKLVVYENTFLTDQDFSNTTEVSTSFSVIKDIEIADLNNDDKYEIIVSDYTGKKLAILSRNNDNTYTELLIGSTNNYESIVVTDFDSDGKLDIISVSYDGKIEFFKNTSTTTLSFEEASVLFDGSDMSSSSIVSGDLDLDGDDDLIVISGSYNFFSFIYMNDDASLSAPIKFYNSAPLYFPEDVELIDLNGDGVLDIVSYVTLNNDFRLYAFIQVNSYKNISLPTPEREEAEFLGWYYDSAFEDAYDPQQMITEDTTLYAKWKRLNMSLVIKDDSGIVFEQTFREGQSLTSVSLPQPAAKEGYTFVKWSAAIPETMSTEDIEINAIYEANTYSITFNVNGGENNALNVSTYTVESSAINLLAPTKVGHTFVGWFENSAFTGTPLTSIQPSRLQNVSLFAKFDINAYTITFDTRGGSVMNPITLDYGSTIPTVTQPTREGYTFNTFNIDIPTIMPAGNVTITVSWALISVLKDDGLDVEVEGLFEAIPDELKTNDDLSVSLVVELADENEENESQILIKSQLGSNQQFQFLDIYVLLTKNQVDVRVSELTQTITISLVLPEEIQGFRGYQVVSVHNGVYRELETEFDETTQTITFVTDKFSSYAIVYNVSTFRDFLIYIILAIALFFMFIVFKRKKKDEEEEKKVVKPVVFAGQKEPKVLQAELKVDAVVIPGVTSRKTFVGGAKVEKGYYLEVTKDFDSTNRIIEVEDDELPNVLTTGNAFISISQKEVGLLSLKGLSAFGLLKKTPGSKGEQGYYAEVDLVNIFTGRTIILVEKLPPSSKKGHRWVRVKTRVIK
jgi:uncharacterized repeat protein (TIGR02543 family)